MLRNILTTIHDRCLALLTGREAEVWEMIGLVEENRAQLVALCARFHVERLEVFGSAATGEFVPGQSDIDFLVVFEPASPRSHKERYFGLLAALEELFGAPVDLVEPSVVRNRYLWVGINASRELLYAA